jgi:hypothetical protein
MKNGLSKKVKSKESEEGKGKEPPQEKPLI